MDRLISFLREHPDQLNAIVASLALVVSLVSIILTCVALWIQRRHNFKSLTPIGAILLGNYEDSLEVKVRNHGVGPLIIEQFVAAAADNPDQIKPDIISWMPRQPDGILYRTFTPSIDGRCIAPNTEIVVIHLEGDPKVEQFARFRDEVRLELSRLVVTLKYKDIYDRRMPPETRSLAWFTGGAELEALPRMDLQH